MVQDWPEQEFGFKWSQDFCHLSMMEGEKGEEVEERSGNDDDNGS
jgi:hypothetical protein